MTPARRWTAICACVIVLAAAAAVAAFNGKGDGDTQNTPGGLAPEADTPTSVAELLPDLVQARLLSIDDGAGRPTAYMSHLDGTDRRVLWDAPDSWPAVSLGGDRLLIAAPWEQRSNDRLEVFTMTGAFDRAISDPPSNESDSSPSLASGTGQVYFIRGTLQDRGHGTKVLESSRLMRVSVAGGTAETVATPGMQLRTVTATADGRFVAGQCIVDADDAGPANACIVETATGRSTIVKAPQPATMSDVAISTTGRWLAYSAPVTNAYGESQIFVLEIALGSQRMATQMSGRNVAPAWIPSGERACFIFEHYERAAGSAVHLTCLQPAPVTVRAVPIGSRPVWLG